MNAYGLDFDVGNDTCPMIGNRDGSAKFVVAADPASGRLPFLTANLPQFVETRSGDYSSCRAADDRHGHDRPDLTPRVYGRPG